MNVFAGTRSIPVKWTIRRAKHPDAFHIQTAHQRSIREVCSKDYTAEQIEAWAGRNIKESTWCQTIDRDYVWVVEKNEQVHGFGHLAIMDQDSAEIMGLYFTPEIRGMGAGKKMLSTMLDEAALHQVSEINLLATITAKTFYESFDFKSLRITSLDMSGKAVPCISMSKTLHLNNRAFGKVIRPSYTRGASP